MSTPRHGLWQAQQVAARWLCLCLSSHFTESGATIECCFHGVFTVYPTSDNDPYVVFGVSGTPCFSRSSNVGLYSCPDVSCCIGSAEAMLVFADADLAPASLLYVFWRSKSVIWSQIPGLFFSARCSSLEGIAGGLHGLLGRPRAGAGSWLIHCTSGLE